MLIGKFTPTDAELGELAADSTNSALGSCAQRPWHFFTLCFWDFLLKLLETSIGFLELPHNNGQSEVLPRSTLGNNGQGQRGYSWAHSLSRQGTLGTSTVPVDIRLWLDFIWNCTHAPPFHSLLVSSCFLNACALSPRSSSRMDCSHSDPQLRVCSWGACPMRVNQLTR